MRAIRLRPLWLLWFIVFMQAPAAAQETPRRDGFWWTLGVSYGWVQVACDICASNRNGALSGTGGIGGTVSPKLRIGAELNGWARDQGEVDEYLGTISGTAYWYPATEGNLYLKGGLGYVAFRIADDEDALTSSGFGPQIGAGYELGLGRHSSLQPYFNFIITIPRGNLYFNGDRQAEGVSLSLLQLGVSLTWH